MDALLTAIVIWISANYALPATFEHPRIERVASIEMAGLRYKGLLSALQRETSAISARNFRHPGTGIVLRKTARRRRAV